VVILLTSFIYNKIRPEKKVVKLKKEIIYNDNTGNKTINGKVNINTATLEDYLKAGVSLSIAKKIVEYKDTVGQVKSLEELKRVAGIGAKTVKKISKTVEVGEGGKLKKLKINSASTEELKYYGFTKKEIKAIENYKKEHEVIYSNIEMMEILGEERYREYENRISY
jgi:competence protein ComEA